MKRNCRECLHFIPLYREWDGLMRWYGLGICRGGRKHRVTDGRDRSRRCPGGKFCPAEKDFPTRIFTKPEVMLDCLLGDGYRKYAAWLAEKGAKEHGRESAPEKSDKADDQ